MNTIKQVRPFDSGDNQVLGIGFVNKQNGGVGEYAKVEVSIRPLEEGETLNQIINAVVGAAIPTEFIASVTDGICDGLAHGPLGGHPVTGVAVTIRGGKAHAQDSSAQAFKEAGKLAVQDALSKSEVALLEPVAKLDITTPAEFLGAIIGDINRRRGQITDMRTAADATNTVVANVPLAETFGYATDLRSLTQGRASFALTPHGYVEAPPSVRDQVSAR